MSVPYLQFSKIGKVMRHIAVLPDDKVPGDAKFRFRDRAKSLVDKWHAVLNAGKPGSGEGEKEGAANTNGDSGAVQEVKEETEKVTEGTKNLDLNAGTNGDCRFSLRCCGWGDELMVIFFLRYSRTGCGGGGGRSRCCRRRVDTRRCHHVRGRDVIP
jgi:hypothetical protein